ncbi:RES family NAD+ phosphorylase [Xenorhabdus bovienii]|uniref:RES family NAD+ phosphorylase n=1 Tax=Xenorhabdus bovienii TaxID=40576 RepID=UPI001EDD37D7|nr:RES family NAD+ phosphorylase [Xenorhabdus bovienii]MCG3472212.1 RES family NAD+ phosphorylase [Xenorhabdus bovienii]
MKPETNQNQTSNTASSTINSDTESKTIEKIENISDNTFHSCTATLLKGSKLFRLQNGEYDGSCVFFNPNGFDTRFGLTDGINGTMYLAYDPLTAMKEVFNGKLGILESDLNQYHIGTVILEKDLQLLDMPKSIKKTSLTLHDVTTSSRSTTQLLAEKVRAAGLDGIKFLSNVTSEECLALWHNDPSGKGVAITKENSMQRLSEFEHQGESAADILVNQLGISVEEG